MTWVSLRAVLLASLLTAPGRASEQARVEGGSDTLSLEAVLESVERHYPVIEAARRDVEAAGAELLAAQGGFDPVLRGRVASTPLGGYPYTRVEGVVEQPTALWGANLFAGWRLGSGQFPTYAEQYQTNALGEVRAGVSVPLWRNGPIDRRRAAVARAELGTNAATQAVEQARLESARVATWRYWEWVAAGRRYAVATELRRMAQARDAQLIERVQSGDLAAFEQVDNQRALVQRDGQVVAAERLLQQSAMELSLFLRDAEGQPVLPRPAWLPPGFPIPVAAEEAVGPLALEDVLERRPDVQRLELSRQQQRVEHQLARNQRAPAVDVSVAAAKDLGAGSLKRDKPELEVGLLLDIPTFNRGATGRALQVEAGLARLEAQLRLQKDRARVEVRDALSALEAARERVTVARRELTLAREIERSERTRFELGESTLLFVNLREQTSAEAAVREVDALTDYHKAVASLRAAAALPVAVR
ncbi:TolC family protein [Myxococcus sp. AM009]|uniref:TolC family protein n=1 Tax=unclassified Myxococcus TaxID=2648731 RepID=UPI0015958606|nr:MULTISPECIES: TolC family protein [unclassified Myxococcus]NVI97132.1 TolC family protein [Myxococcus sp. AM009]NVJ13112.1 TolC family protein [Myxococcus sp. AM010]